MKRIKKIRSIPISAITVTNPRDRLAAPFREIVHSIERVGLKKPITVSERKRSGRYELVCGQGRIEAFTKLKATDIPAILTNLATEDCILLSLVENIARRRHAPVELVGDIGRLAERYEAGEIAAKLGTPLPYVKAVSQLLESGEDELIKALERRAITPTMAIEIARADTPELQAALLELYKGEKRTVNEIAKIRRLFQLRRLQQRRRAASTPAEKEITAAGLVRAYRRETDRQKAVRQKAELAQMRLLFIVSALRTLLKERMFVSLLRDERLDKLPLPLLRQLAAAPAGAT